MCLNDDPGLTLTYFTGRSNLVPCAFAWENGKTMDFSETVVVYEYQRSRSFTDLGPRSLRFNIFIFFFLGTA